MNMNLVQLLCWGIGFNIFLGLSKRNI